LIKRLSAAGGNPTPSLRIKGCRTEDSAKLTRTQGLASLGGPS
jgi:hypothetical protein